MSLLESIEDLDREDTLKKSSPLVEAERQCRLTLSKDWKKEEQRESRRVVTLEWNPGGSNGRTSIIQLRPGGTITQPLWRAMAWFGPFGLLPEFTECRKMQDNARMEKLRHEWAVEKMRVLMRYDYPRAASYAKDGYDPIGPHRFPDVTAVIIDSDGSELPEIRLHKVYKIGEFDEIYPLESFGKHETVDEVRAKYESELTGVSAKYEQELAAMRLQMAEVLGHVKGLSVSVKSAAANGG